MKNPTQRQVWIAITGAGVLMLVLWWWCHAARQIPHGDRQVDRPASTVTTSPPTAGDPAGAASAASGTGGPHPPLPAASPDTGRTLVALTVKFRDGRLVEEGRASVAGVARSSRRIEGMTGLYHRIIGPGGAVLFENIVKDPTVVPWDTTDDGRTLRGGVVRAPDLPVQIRLPAGVSGRLEVFRVETGGLAKSAMADAGHLVGTFTLP